MDVRRLVARTDAPPRATVVVAELSALAVAAVMVVLAVIAVAAAAAVLIITSALTASPAGATDSQPDASALYKAALATTKEWYVHYMSSSTQSKVTLVESGNAGPASGTQKIRMGKGKDLDDNATIDVIGGTTFIRGNANGLQALAGFSATQASSAAGEWIQFSTDADEFSSVVAGVRSGDLAQELALKGPLKLKRSHMQIDGHTVEGIEGTQTLGHKSVRVVLYVRADGRHVPVEEESLNARGKPTAAEHIVYSSWGETVRPEAPQASYSIGKTNSV